MRRPLAALLSCLVILIGQSAEATNYHVYKKFEALCQFDKLKCCSHDMLVSPLDLAYADAGGGQSFDEAAPRSAQPTHQSDNRLARGGPLHLYRSSAGKIDRETAQPAQRQKKNHAGYSRYIGWG
jgi:hypothetical protein